jgi:hypothetical protein
MHTKIEVRGFMGLRRLFEERGWTNPHWFELEEEISGPELVKLLKISNEQVEAIFVNRKAYPCDVAKIRPGDRVALAPPGVPGPYRVLLGFKDINEG